VDFLLLDMFSVSRFDPRTADARKNNSSTRSRKKKAKSRGKDGDAGEKERTKKRKKGIKSDEDHDTAQNQPSSSMATKSTAISTDGERERPESTADSTAPSRVTESKSEAAFRVIAPETDGAISSQKNLSGKITTEAFDDLDLTDDAWLASSSKQERSSKEKGKDNKLGNDPESPTQDGSSLSFDPSDEIERALKMTRLPIVEAARRWGMADFLVRNLRSNGHEHFFPVQALVIPDVIVAERHMTSLRVRDVCCAAPTGSGKTLAFVLPVLNALATRKVRRLRALVILPSRDLAQQVYEVFDAYRRGSENDLRIGLAIGQTDFQAEQKKLIFGDDDGKDKSWTRLRSSLDPGNLEAALDSIREELKTYNDSNDESKNRNSDNRTPRIPSGGISAVDVLVCTPGRLVDHLDNTPGFTLQHLRWLVIDEADRLLSQSYHGWIQRVIDCVHTPPTPPSEASDNDNTKDHVTMTLDPIAHRRSEHDSFVTTATNANDTTSSSYETGTSGTICQRIQLRKLLYSATLTKDPQKLSSLRLVNPKYFNAHDLKRRQAAANAGHNRGNSAEETNAGNEKLEGSLYRMPEQLKECTVECTAEQKPIVLLALLLERLEEYRKLEESAARSASEPPQKHTIVVFASSLESTHRLTRLLQLLWQAANYGTPPVEFSSALNQHQRSRLMKRCNDPGDRSVSVLVCSDGMSRGMDLASCRAVIHYDVPGMAKTYVHRCGRTARAGQDGTAIALLKGKGQAGQFGRLRKLIALPERVTKASVKTSLVRDAIPLYKHCVSRLRDVLAAEDRNELKPTDPDLTRWLPGNESGVSDDDSVDSDDDDDDSSSSTSASSMSIE